MKQPAKGEKPRTTLQTVERALTVLEYVAQSAQPPTVREVADGIGLNITTVYHLFNTLEQRGYLTRDVRGTLRIGARAAVLHQGMVSGLVPNRDLYPVIEKLSADLEETTYLTSWADDAVVIQAVVEAPQALRVSGLYVGYRGREVHRASGKAVLAFLPTAIRQQLIRRNLQALEDDEAARIEHSLPRELARVAREGFAIDNQTYTPGVHCIAAPYFTADGMVGGSVTVSVPAVRFPKRRKHLVDAVRTAAATCSDLMGYHGGEQAAGSGSAPA